jgi:hypothetical protein
VPKALLQAVKVFHQKKPNGVVGALGMVSSLPPWTMVSEIAMECRTPFGLMPMRSAIARAADMPTVGSVHAENDAHGVSGKLPTLFCP